MKLKCIENVNRADVSFTLGRIYEVVRETDCVYYVTGDDDTEWCVNKDTLEYCGNPAIGVFEIVDESTSTDEFFWKDQTEPVFIATLRSIQEQCSRANLSISIDPEGFNIFDCDTDMQTMVHSAADAVEILETKLEYKDSMGKWGWQ